jgi:hypothetical protein
MGVLQVELIDAKGLHGSDRSGKSDVGGSSNFGHTMHDHALTLCKCYYCSLTSRLA